jgi:hypothetical protein
LIFGTAAASVGQNKTEQPMSKSPDRQPVPRRGWSRSCISVAPALVVPPTVSRMVQPAGVFGPGGWVEQSVTWRGGKPMMVAPDSRPDPVARLAGRHLWCGQLWAHFGHFTCESLARVWGIARAGGAESLLFVPKRPKLGEGVRRYQKELLSLLQVDVPVRVLTEPTEVEELVVPGQGFGLGRIAEATPEFRDFVRSGLEAAVPPEGPERLYLSRSGLGGLEGGALLETRLEERLAAAGYEIYQPERHPIRHQLARYRAATHVLGLDGSALHLFGFVARATQRCGIVLRRNSGVFRSLAAQIESFSGRAPDIVHAIAADWVPEGQGRPSRNSFAELDFAMLGAKLTALGFIASPEGWTQPSGEALEADMLRLTGRRGAAYRRVPSPLRVAEPVAA